jgi:hypothetical protein
MRLARRLSSSRLKTAFKRVFDLQFSVKMVVPPSSLGHAFIGVSLTDGRKGCICALHRDWFLPTGELPLSVTV